MSVVLRNWARRRPVLSGYPTSPRRGPLVTPEMCPRFLLMLSVARKLRSLQPHWGLCFVGSESFFRPKPSVSSHWGPEDVIRLSLAYLGLLSWSVQSLARSLPERAFDDATEKQTTTNEYFCINLISSRAFSGSKEGRKGESDRWMDRCWNNLFV